MSAICHNSTCNAEITLTPAGPDDWAWRDGEGSTVGTNYPPGFESPTFWADLKERDIAAYSLLNARDQLGMTGWVHPHYPKPGTREPFTGTPVQLSPKDGDIWDWTVPWAQWKTMSALD